MNPSAPNDVILVDTDDREIGTMEKLEAHQRGLLHRAFSVFLFNSAGEMLIHRRAKHKYHCGGKWSNACCSHPVSGIDIETCLREKLFQEMGIESELVKAFEYTYRAELENGLIEHEYDHVYIGKYNGSPDPNPDEADDWRYASVDSLRKEMIVAPERFTPWFKMLFEKVVQHQAEFGFRFQQF